MTDNFLHFVVAADPEDADGWVNILFIGAIIIFWVINFIRVRAKHSETKQTTGKSEEKPKTLHKSIVETLLKEVLGVPEEAVSKPKPKQPSRRPSRLLEKKPQQRTLKQAISLQSQSLGTIDEKVIPDDDVFTQDVVQEVLNEPSKTEETKVEAFGGVFNLDDLLKDGTGELRKAILYYEILGKPLSLRDTQTHLF
ncbi:MAG: hypothetical protein ACYTE8_01465 [Planctomycetota bacterium]|jgi:hypothetical protein